MRQLRNWVELLPPCIKLISIILESPIVLICASCHTIYHRYVRTLHEVMYQGVGGTYHYVWLLIQNYWCIYDFLYSYIIIPPILILLIFSSKLNAHQWGFKIKYSNCIFWDKMWRSSSHLAKNYPLENLYTIWSGWSTSSS